MAVRSIHLVTYAQNATPVHRHFWAALNRCAALYDAQLHVVAGRYKNPTSVHADKDHDWWAPEVVPHVRKRHALCRNLVVHGEISISPTAEYPLTGFERFAGEHSAIFGHPKIQLTTIPCARKLPRIFTSTGACTVPNYTESKAGVKGAAHHTLGATLVEIDDDGRYFIRQIHAQKNGAFIDLGLRFAHDGVTVADAPVLVLGDIHAELLTPADTRAMYSVIEGVKPRQIVVHDVIDFEARSHHNRHKWWEQGRLESGDVIATLDEACAVLNGLAHHAPVDVIHSNHHEHVDRWLQECDPREDMLNFDAWCLLWRSYRAAGRNPPTALARWWAGMQPLSPHAAGVKFRAPGTSVRHYGIECGYHGHEAWRGGAQSFVRLGTKCTIGHTHSPSIIGPLHTVGCTPHPDRFGYAENQISRMLTCHGLIYPNGKRTLLPVIDGKFRA